MLFNSHSIVIQLSFMLRMSFIVINCHSVVINDAKQMTREALMTMNDGRRPNDAEGK